MPTLAPTNQKSHRVKNSVVFSFGNEEENIMEKCKSCVMQNEKMVLYR